MLYIDSVFILLQNGVKLMMYTMYSPFPLVSIVTGGYLCVLSLSSQSIISHFSGARGG